MGCKSCDPCVLALDWQTFYFCTRGILLLVFWRIILCRSVLVLLSAFLPFSGEFLIAFDSH